VGTRRTCLAAAAAALGLCALTSFAGEPAESTCPVGASAAPPAAAALPGLKSDTKLAEAPADADAAFGPPDDHLDPPKPTLLMRFRDHLNLSERVQSLRSISLLRLWDGRNVSFYLGVDRSGIYGLHFQRNDPREYYSEMPPPSDLTLLRFRKGL
jgi:hypothetical protein